jgi:carbon storage regulator
MLVLSRKPGEKITIDNAITLTVLAVSGNKVRVGIDAPSNVHIFRAELVGRPQDLTACRCNTNSDPCAAASSRR